MIAITIQPESRCISPNVIEKGKIEKYLLYRNSEWEVLLLEIFPGASITRTKEICDKEIYFFVQSKCLKFYDQEREGEIAFNYSNEILKVIYIRATADVKVPQLMEVLNVK